MESSAGDVSARRSHAKCSPCTQVVCDILAWESDCCHETEGKTEASLLGKVRQEPAIRGLWVVHSSLQLQWRSWCWEVAGLCLYHCWWTAVVSAPLSAASCLFLPQPICVMRVMIVTHFHLGRETNQTVGRKRVVSPNSREHLMRKSVSAGLKQRRCWNQMLGDAWSVRGKLGNILRGNIQKRGTSFQETKWRSG